MDWSHALTLLLIAFAVNLLLGKWRSTLKRLSFQWFIAIHLSVPLVVFLRLYWQLPVWLVLFTIGAAVLAQYLGGTMQPERLPIFKKRS